MSKLGLIDLDGLEMAAMKFNENHPDSPLTRNDFKLIDSFLSEYPTVDATPVIHARWQRVNPFVDTEECSNCRYNIPSDEFETPYCPWCNAKMGGDNS